METDVVGVLTLVEVEVEALVLTDVDTLVDLLELNEVDVETDVVGVLTLVEVEVDTLVVTDVEVLVLALE